MLGFQLMHVPLTPRYDELVQRWTRLGEQFSRVLWPPIAPLDWPPPRALQQDRFDVITHTHLR